MIITHVIITMVLTRLLTPLALRNPHPCPLPALLHY